MGEKEEVQVGKGRYREVRELEKSRGVRLCALLVSKALHPLS